MTEDVVKQDIRWGNKRILVEKKYLESGISNYFYTSKIYWNRSENENHFTDKAFSGENEVDDIVAEAVGTIRDQ